MANTFTPVASESYDGQLVFAMTDYVVEDTIKKYISSVDITHRSKFVNKLTGFETSRYTWRATSGTDLLVNIRITFVGGLTRAIAQQLWNLAVGVNGAGMEIDFRDDWISSYTYSCKWTNAADFSDSSTIMNGGTMKLDAYDWTAI